MRKTYTKNMLDLTSQERKVILFLLAVILIGIGVNFAVKMNTGIERAISDGNIAKININRASIDDLINSGSITEKLAQKIIEYCRTSGPIDDIAELKEIKGIGDKKLEKIEEVFFAE